MKRHRLVPPGLSLVALGAQLILATSASAGTRHADFGIPANGVGTGTASCPTGERATGGGYVASKSEASVSIGASRKVGQSAWRVTVQSYSGVADTGTAYVYCGSQAPVTKEVAKTQQLSHAGVAETAIGASCEGFGAVQAGGFSTPAKKGIVVTSRRIGSLWRVRAQAVAGTAGSATSYAYCSKSGKPVAREGAPVSGSGFEVKTALSAPCAGGRAPLAGGFRQPDRTMPGGDAFGTPSVSRRLNGRWRVTAGHSTQDQNSGALVSIAYCPSAG